MPTMTITLADQDWQILCHDLLDPEAWFRGVLAEKLARCQERLLAQGQRLLLADPAVKQMPATVEGLVKMTLSHPDYQNRPAREVAALSAGAVDLEIKATALAEDDPKRAALLAQAASLRAQAQTLAGPAQ